MAIRPQNHGVPLAGDISTLRECKLFQKEIKMAIIQEECGKEIHERTVFCPRCGESLGIATAGPGDAMPQGVKGWSWGAFLLNGIWAIGNRTWIGLLMFVPYVWFVMPFVLGFKGREWAWKNRRWESVDHFNRVQREWSTKGIVAACAIIIFLPLVPFAIPDSYIVKSKLSKIISTLDPVKVGVERAYREKGRIPAMHTIVTSANQGQAATPDWAALGFVLMPSLPTEVKRLEFSSQDCPEIVVELDKIDKAIDGTSVRAKLIVAGEKLSWQYETTSSDPRARHFFQRSHGTEPVLDEHAREKGCAGESGVAAPPAR